MVIKAGLLDKIQTSTPESRSAFFAGLSSAKRQEVLTALKQEKALRQVPQQDIVAGQQEALAAGRFPGQPFAFAAQPQVREAQQQALDPLGIAKGIPSAIQAIPSTIQAARELQPKDIPFEEILGTLGTVGGAGLASPIAPGAGTVAGGIAGGILGASFGRRVDIITGKIDPESQLSSFGKAVGTEALAGAVAIPLNLTAKALGKPGLRFLSKKFQGTRLEPIINTIYNNPTLKITSQLLKATDIDAKTGRTVTIDQAANRLLGENTLTPFEQSGGRAGQGLQKKLNFAVQDMVEKNLEGSAALTARKKNANRLRNIVGGISGRLEGVNFRERKRLAGIQIKDQFDKALKHVKSIKNPIATMANNLGARSKADVSGLLDEINALKQQAIIQTKDPERVNILFDSLNKGLTTQKFVKEGARPSRAPVSGQTLEQQLKGVTTEPQIKIDPFTGARETIQVPIPTRDVTVSGVPTATEVRTVSQQLGIPTLNEKTFSQLDIIDKQAKDKLTEFNANLNVQDDRVAAWYTDNVLPLIRQRKQTASDIAGDGSTQSNALAAADKLQEIVQVQDLIVNTKLGREIGIAKSAQKKKQFPEDEVLDKIFQNTDNWQTAERLFELSNPDIIPVLKDRFKLDILGEALNRETGEVSFNKLMAIRQKHGDDLITMIGGEDYANDLIESALLARGLEASRGLGNLAAGKPVGLEDVAAGWFRPLQKDVTMFKAIMSGGKNALGLNKLDDKALFSKLKGDKGLRLLEKLQATPLDSPNAYLTYVELARTLDLAPITIEFFTQQVQSLLNAWSNGMASETGLPQPPEDQQIQQQ